MTFYIGWAAFLWLLKLNIGSIIYLCFMARKLIYLILLLFPVYAFTQISEGGYPAGMDLKGDDGNYKTIELAAPQIDFPESGTSAPGPYKVGEAIVTDIQLLRDGTWSADQANGSRILRLAIRSENARGLILYYNSFNIPDGGMLYIYSKDGSQLIGAFTSKNNPSGGFFATEMIKGDELVIEYNAPPSLVQNPQIDIYEVHYVFRDVDPMLKGLSGPCEVNVNCSEGENWQGQKRSVAKILLRDGGVSYLCTGTLINNTRQDSTPYFLTARHCGSNASANDYSQWVFYFNYESTSCETPPDDPPSNTISGCEMLAQASESTSMGSDFKLLRLNQDMPDAYNPYFAGWNRSGVASSSGVGIHHPKGDIKKISTYTEPLISTTYSQPENNPNGLYWKITWAETQNGHGVTEGGSSGSPIFDPAGNIVGTLTGGAASCSDLTAPDWYGKFSYHWESNGSPAGSQLKPFLDPDNTGLQSFNGFGYGTLLRADFRTDNNVISIGSSVSFTDQSTGDPDSWEWYFSGADVSHFSGQAPSGIRYSVYGSHSVKLSIGRETYSDSITKREYIRVVPNLWPVPANDKVNLDFGKRQLDFIEVEMYNVQGQKVMEYSSDQEPSGVYTIALDGVRAGTYYLQVKTNIQVDVIPFVVYSYTPSGRPMK